MSPAPPFRDTEFKVTLNPGGGHDVVACCFPPNPGGGTAAVAAAILLLPLPCWGGGPFCPKINPLATNGLLLKPPARFDCSFAAAVVAFCFLSFFVSLDEIDIGFAATFAFLLSTLFALPLGLFTHFGAGAVHAVAVGAPPPPPRLGKFSSDFSFNLAGAAFTGLVGAGAAAAFTIASFDVCFWPTADAIVYSSTSPRCLAEIALLFTCSWDIICVTTGA